MSARRLALLSAAVAVLAAARYAPIVSEPLDTSLASTNAECMARHVRCWRKAGFAEVRGVPQYFILPTKPPTAIPYVHHPPLYPWMIHATVEVAGWSEAGFRLLPILFAAGAGGFLTWIAGAAAGARWGAAAGLIYLTSPMGLFFGWMPNPESGVLFAMLLTWILHERFRSSGAGRYAWVLGAYFFGSLLDWQMQFLAPGIWLRECLEPRSTRRLGRALLLFPVGVLNFALTIALWSWWSGPIGDTLRQAFATATVAYREGSPATASAWLANQGRFWLDYYGLPVAIATLAATPFVIRAAIRAGDPLARAAAAMAFPAVLNVAVFPHHAYDHTFWWYYALPYVALACAWSARRLADSRLPWLAAALLAACAGWGVARAVRLHREFRSDFSPRLAAELNRFAGPNDALWTPPSFGQESFYLDAWLLPPTFDPAFPARLAEMAKAKNLSVDRIVCLVPESIRGLYSMRAIVEALPGLGRLRRIEPEELRREAPCYSVQIGDATLWVLTLEPS